MNYLNQPQTQNLQYKPKIVLLGADAVGKSQFVRKLCSNTFTDDYSETIGGCFETKILQTAQRPYSCHIWETSGQEKYQSMAPLYLKGAQSVLILFSVGNPDSFYKAQDFLDLARRECSPHAYILLVGTQSDLTLQEAASLVLKFFSLFQSQTDQMSYGMLNLEMLQKNTKKTLMEKEEKVISEGMKQIYPAKKYFAIIEQSESDVELKKNVYLSPDLLRVKIEPK